jgi:hypothetical protein
LVVSIENFEPVVDEICIELGVFTVFLGDIFLVFRLLPEELSDEKKIEVSGKLNAACLD